MENEEVQPSPFDEPDVDQTLALKVEGRKFWVPRGMMSLYSPVFKAMLYGNFQEVHTDLIELNGEEAKDFEEILRCLIPTPTCKEIDRSNLELVLEFSQKYEIADLRRKANEYLALLLERCPKNGQDLLYILPIAAKWRLKVLEQCLNRCVEELDLASLLPIFKDVPDPVKAYLALGGSGCHVEHLGGDVGYCSIHLKESYARCTDCSKYWCSDCLDSRYGEECNGKAKIDEMKKALLDRMKRI